MPLNIVDSPLFFMRIVKDADVVEGYISSGSQ